MTSTAQSFPLSSVMQLRLLATARELLDLRVKARELQEKLAREVAGLRAT